MADGPRVSICIRGWRAAEAEQAIASAVGQSHRDLEIVVSDDSGSLEPLVRRFGDARIRYYANARPLGPQGNLAAALDRATGELVGVLDDDDWLCSTYVEEIVDRFEADPSLGVTFTNHFFASDGHLRPRRCALRGGRYADITTELLEHRPVAMSAAVMRREVWQTFPRATPPVDSLVLWFHAAREGWPFYYLDRPLMVYRVHPGQGSNDELPMRERGVALWSSLRFADREHERLRRRRLAAAHLSRGYAHLKRGQLEEAFRDFESSRAAASRRDAVRAWMARGLTRRPELIGAALHAYRTGHALARRLRRFAGPRG